MLIRARALDSRAAAMVAIDAMVAIVAVARVSTRL